MNNTKINAQMLVKAENTMKLGKAERESHNGYVYCMKAMSTAYRHSKGPCSEQVSKNSARILQTPTSSPLCHQTS